MVIIMINKNGFGRTERARIAFQCIHSKCRVLFRSSYVSYIHMVLLLFLMSTLNTRTHTKTKQKQNKTTTTTTTTTTKKKQHTHT